MTENTMKLRDVAERFAYAQCFIPSFTGWGSTFGPMTTAALAATFPDLEVEVHHEQEIEGVGHLHGTLFHPGAEGYFVILAQTSKGE